MAIDKAQIAKDFVSTMVGYPIEDDEFVPAQENYGNLIAAIGDAVIAYIAANGVVTATGTTPAEGAVVSVTGSISIP